MDGEEKEEGPCRGERETRAPSQNSRGILRPGSLPLEMTGSWDAWQRNTTSSGERPDSEIKEMHDMSAREGNSGNESSLGRHAMEYVADYHFFYHFGCFTFKTPTFFSAIVSLCSEAPVPHVTRLFWFYRKREARRLFLTMKINLQFYYIPVHNTTSPISPVKVDHLDPLCRPQLCPDNNVNNLRCI